MGLFDHYRGFGFTRDCVLFNVPEDSGIYGLYSALWIYVGEADNLRARLLLHLSEGDPGLQTYRPTSFAFELVPAHERRERLEHAIRKLEPLLQNSRVMDFSGWEMRHPRTTRV